MPDTTFESLLTSQLREYAEAGVRPIDRYAIAEGTIASGRAVPRWRRSWGLAPMRGNRFLIPLLVGLLLAALVGGALLVGGRLPAPPPLPMQHTYLNELVSGPGLPTPMGRPVLVPLLDGRVLVVDSSDPRALALLYDPATGASVAAGPMVSAGQLLVSSAVRLRDGRVLIIGDTAIQIFDPTTMRFARVGPTVTARSGGTAARLLDGRVLITGGSSPIDGARVLPAELFDPDTLTFSATGSVGTRNPGRMATLPDGRVFVASPDGDPEVYDPATGTFSAAGATSGGGGDPVALPDGRVVLLSSSGVYSGGSIEVWDPISSTFSASSLPEPLTGATLLDDGRVLLIGMCRGRPAGWTGLYDPATEVTIPTPGTRGCRPTSTKLADGRVLIVGGTVVNDVNAVSTVEIFR